MHTEPRSHDVRITLSDGEVEAQRLHPTAPRPGPTLVFLHEGLGSVALWRGFPAQVVALTGLPGLVYSRFGYGRSSPASEQRTDDYLHREASPVLGEVLAAEGIERPVLVGHSDGASIALIAAADRALDPAAIVAMAPHVLVEDGMDGPIEGARQAYESTDWPERLARYHDDPEWVFWSWFDIWTSPGFASWDIRDRLPEVTCPTLMIQGTDDEYATMVHLDEIERRVAGPTRRLELPDCRHSPHLEAPHTTAGAIADFLDTILRD